MHGLKPVMLSELEVGRRIARSLFDRNGRLLLKAGSAIGSQRQLDALRMRGAFEYASAAPKAGRAEPAVDDSSPFLRLDDLVRRMPSLFQALADGTPNTGERILRLVRDLRALYADHPDAMLGAVHLTHEYDYTLCHPIHTALLCELIARMLDYSSARIDSLVAAALTQNVAMLELQETLQCQQEPLSEAQREELEAHPRRAVEMLRRAGVEDETWLNTVLQHHERYNGRGYPAGLQGDEVMQEAQIVALSDRYSAQISSRAYRDGLVAKEALRYLYLSRGSDCSGYLTELFISAIGVFPPGSFVRLANGEVGIVVERGREPLRPVVSSFLSARGAMLARPFRRDTRLGEYQVRGGYPPATSSPINLTAIWRSVP